MKLIDSIAQDLAPEKQYLKDLSVKVTAFCSELQLALKKRYVSAEISLGGSFAKNTMVKKAVYDIDILVRFKEEREQLSDVLERVLISMKKHYVRVHGSRDYFQIQATPHAIFEIIPVLYITRPSQAENVTDLTHFHVAYVKKNIRGLEDEVRLAKQFCEAQGVYGAESYIQGFSGYALECLIIYYKSFMKLVKTLAKYDSQIIIDPAHHYTSKENILVSLNQSKLKSPIVFVDPTFKERNVLAALNEKSFDKIKIASQKFLKTPSRASFVPHRVNIDALKKEAQRKKADMSCIALTTNRQAGDIAGTKLKKFHYFLEHEVAREFDIIHHEFQYDGAQKGTLYLLAKSKKKFLKRGPPVIMEKHAKAFKKQHSNAFEKKGILYAEIILKDSLHAFLKRYATDNKMLTEHAITAMNIESL